MILRIINLGVLAFILSGCKADLQIPRSEVSFEFTCVDQPCDEDFEQVEKIHYTHGGWFGPYPNFVHDLVLERKGNKVVGELKTVICKVKGEVSIRDYRSLIRTILTSEVKIDDGPHFIDSGNKVITLYGDDALVNYFLKRGDDSYGELVFKDQDAVEEKVLEIISDLKQQSIGCIEPNVGA